MTTTFRADTVAGLLSILNDFISSNPTLLRRAFSARPASWTTDTPVAWVETRGETVAHDSGLRMRTLQPQVVVLDRLTDNVETMDRMDVLVDTLLDAFSANPHISSNTAWDQLTVSDEVEQLPDGTWATVVRFTFPNVMAREGRP